MILEQFAKGDTQWIRIRDRSGEVLIEMTMANWSFMIANPLRVNK